MYTYIYIYKDIFLVKYPFKGLNVCYVYCMCLCVRAQLAADMMSRGKASQCL